MFRIGQKVICVNNDGAAQLNLNGIYTIKNILPYGEWKWNGNIVKTTPVEVYETNPDPGLQGFHCSRFRPSVDRKTDISIFQKMLTPRQVNV